MFASRPPRYFAAGWSLPESCGGFVAYDTPVDCADVCSVDFITPADVDAYDGGDGDDGDGGCAAMHGECAAYREVTTRPNTRTQELPSSPPCRLLRVKHWTLRC